MTKTTLEVNNEKLEAELEETKQRLLAALSKTITEGADSKMWKASVVTRSTKFHLKLQHQLQVLHLATSLFIPVGNNPTIYQFSD